MKSSILLDASHYRAHRPTGVERYVDHLFPVLDKLLRDEGIEPVYLTQQAFEAKDPLHFAKQVVIPYRRFWSSWAVKKAVKELNVSLYFTPSGIPPLKLSVPTAVTVHDLAVYQVPSAYSFSDRVRLGSILKVAAKNSRLIFTPSQFVSDSVRKLWKVAAQNLVVTPLAPTEQKVGDSTPPNHALPKNYLLYVGRVEAKKNLETIVRSFALYRQHGGKLSLVIAGSPGFGAGALYQLVGELPEELAKAIHLLGYVSDDERRWLYSHATACIVPSPYEGFGLPVLEAFEAGVAIAASDSGALPEVVGDAGILVPPKSPAAWQEAFQELEKHTVREALTVKGSARLKHYSWRKTAKTTAEAIARVI
jgi:glycosyltransferase involved in cell wall biosynthesis